MAGMGGGDMDDEDEYNGGSPFGGQNNGDADFMDQYANPTPPPEPEPVIQVQGMKLGKKKKGKVDLMSKMAAEDGLDVRASMPQEEIADAPPPPPQATSSQPIALAVEEKLTISLSQEGALEAFDLKGTLSLTANDDVAAACRLTVAHKTAAAGTTFATHPKVDKKAWETLVQRQIDGGVAGIVPVGCTGEAAVLSRDEREWLVRKAVEMCAGKCAVVAGSGSNSTDITLRQTEDVKAWGADAAMLISPYYNKPQQAGLLAHYRTVARAVDIPENRTLFVGVWLAAAALGIAALVKAGWIGRIAAVPAIFVGLFLPFTVSIREQILPPNAIRVGETIPAFSAPDDRGEIFDSARLRGKPVLIKFFRAHW